MAVYTDLKREDIELILNEYGLNLISYSRIKTGILNTNYAIITNLGKFIMRIFEVGSFVYKSGVKTESVLEI